MIVWTKHKILTSKIVSVKGKQTNREMEKNKEIKDSNKLVVAKEGQCHFFVLRKKRLCRMTVRPGRQYCGEHEPPPPPDDAQADKRVPCPNDPKHTVYVSKLEKHLTICNARAGTAPAYIVPHINTPPTPTEHDDDGGPRVPLALVPGDTLIKLIEKINRLYDEHVKDNIKTAVEHPIHSAVSLDFNDASRTESSRRHLRQVSQLMWLVEDEGLVHEDTCYIELGAGKGQLSYYMGVSWCAGSSRVLPVDRAALRHKRERRGHGGGGGGALRPGAVQRLRADLAHLALDLVPHLEPATHLVGLAKHLCGVATDYAIRCVVNARRARALVVATCCHHRCEANTYLGKGHLQELGISGPELNIMLGVVSWATCGDGQSRDLRLDGGGSSEPRGRGSTDRSDGSRDPSLATSESRLKMSQEYRESVGRRAKALLDWGRVLRLRTQGFDATLAYYVSTTVSLENVCIIAKKQL